MTKFKIVKQIFAVYCDQQMGALHTVRLSKSSFLVVNLKAMVKFNSNQIHILALVRHCGLKQKEVVPF